MATHPVPAGTRVDITELSKPLIRQILRTSEGFPTRRAGALAHVRTDAGGARSVSPKPVGHALASHVRGADAIANKTKYCSLDDQAEALWLLLSSPAGIHALSVLATGVRQTVEGDVGRLFPIEATVPGVGAVTFTTADQQAVGITGTRCVAVLEGRARADRVYLHIHTCYPKLQAAQISLMAARKPTR
jgi:hypothetical protein